MVSYSLLHRCTSECLAAFVSIFLVESLLANKLLPKTKGHNIGFGFVAFGIGFAIFIPLQCFGYISSALNPAVTFASAIAGDIPWDYFPCIALAQLVGSFSGAVLVWVFYLPHFLTVPEPPPKKEEDRLLRTRDDLGQNALQFASYNTSPIRYTLSSHIRSFRRMSLQRHGYRAEDVLGRDAVLGRQGLLNRRRSVTIADLHGRLGRLEQQHGCHDGSFGQKRRRLSGTRRTNSQKRDSPVPHQCTSINMETVGEEVSSPFERQRPVMRHESLAAALAEHEKKHNLYFTSGTVEVGPPEKPAEGNGLESSFQLSQGKPPLGSSQKPSLKPAQKSEKPFGAFAQMLQNPFTKEDAGKVTRADLLADASIRADQNAKLAVFCMRPSIYAPFSNFLAEVITTAALVLGIFMISQRGGMVHEPSGGLYDHGLKALYVGILFAVLILSLGGTGTAMNPARDFGPRLAHYLLPIAGKGSSEWYYAWIPILGPFCGGALGAGLFQAIKLLNKSGVEGGFYDDHITSLLDTIP